MQKSSNLSVGTTEHLRLQSSSNTRLGDNNTELQHVN